MKRKINEQKIPRLATSDFVASVSLVDILFSSRPFFTRFFRFSSLLQFSFRHFGRVGRQTAIRLLWARLNLICFLRRQALMMTTEKKMTVSKRTREEKKRGKYSHLSDFIFHFISMQVCSQAEGHPIAVSRRFFFFTFHFAAFFVMIFCRVKKRDEKSAGARASERKQKKKKTQTSIRQWKQI